MFHFFRWWARGLRDLRHPSLVRGLSERKAERDTFDAVRNTNAKDRVRIHRGAVFAYWAPEKLELAEAVAIERGTILWWGGGIEDRGFMSFGAHTWIGPYNNFRTARGGEIRLGQRCLVSQFCSFVSHNHGVRKNQPIQLQPDDDRRANITVGDDVWFGMGCAILPGARVGDGAVIGAGSVVTGDVPAYEIWAGVPARNIGERK